MTEVDTDAFGDALSTLSALAPTRRGVQDALDRLRLVYTRQRLELKATTTKLAERDETIKTLQRMVQYACAEAESLDRELTAGRCQAPSGEGTHCALYKPHDGQHVDRRGLNYFDEEPTGD